MKHDKQSSELLDVTVQRLSNNTVELCWKPVDVRPKVSICSGLRKNANLTEVPLDGSKNGCLKIKDLDTSVRYYYHVVDNNGNRILTAERRVPLEGPVNFRDIGGYKTDDGREVQWGKIFRADGLSRLTHKDHKVMGHIGINRVFDLRTPAEVNEAPDNLPESSVIRYKNIPVTHGEFDFVDAMAKMKTGDVSWLTPDFMRKGYIRNIEEFPHVWGTIINFLADKDMSAIVFHCTGGKDRTGTCAALILLMLGVSEETIIEDHQLSNIYIADLLPKIFKLISSYGIDPDAVYPYLTAPKDCILAVLEHIKSKYGTASEYLAEKAGVKKETQKLLKEKLLR